MPSGADKDPEQRIAELERPLLQSAADGEMSSVRPRVGLRLGWAFLVLMIAGLIVGGGAILAGRDDNTVPGRPTAPTMIGGGGTVAETPSSPTLSPPIPPIPPIPPVRPAPSIAPPNAPIGVAGVGNERTIDCADNEITISGVDNSVVLTGHCSRVDVSGVRNTVTIDSADAIAVSGIDNVVIFHFGTPALDKSGLDNTLERG